MNKQIKVERLHESIKRTLRNDGYDPCYKIDVSIEIPLSTLKEFYNKRDNALLEEIGALVIEDIISEMNSYSRTK